VIVHARPLVARIGHVLHAAVGRATRVTCVRAKIDWLLDARQRVAPEYDDGQFSDGQRIADDRHRSTAGTQAVVHVVLHFSRSLLAAGPTIQGTIARSDS
jgi:hypothetical protein